MPFPWLSTGRKVGRYSKQIRIGSPFEDRRKPVTKKLLVTLIASAFAVTAFAQAPKSDTAPKAPAATEAKKDATPAPKAKGEKKAKAKGEKKAKAKGKAKSDEAKK
jgi:hypothetical protein